MRHVADAPCRTGTIHLFLSKDARTGKERERGRGTCRCPAFVDKNMALIEPHLAGPHQMRSAVLHCVARVIEYRSTPAELGAESSTQLLAQQLPAHRETSAKLLEILVHRTHDESPYTRQTCIRVRTSPSKVCARPLPMREIGCRFQDSSITGLYLPSKVRENR